MAGGSRAGKGRFPGGGAAESSGKLGESSGFSLSGRQKHPPSAFDLIWFRVVFIGR